MSDFEVRTLSLAYVEQIADDGELKHPLRRRLHAEIEELVGRDQWDSYIAVGKACAVRAWPVWRSKFSDSLPVASPLPSATPERPELALTDSKTKLGSLATFLDNRIRTGPEVFAAGFAGLACWAVNRDVLAGVFLSPPDRDEADIYPEHWEASLYASVALAGGPVWEGSGDASVRREFWQWYLEDAVPRFYPA